MKFTTVSEWANAKSLVTVGDKAPCIYCNGLGEIACDCSCPHCEHFDTCDECVNGRITVDDEFMARGAERLKTYYLNLPVSDYVDEMLNAISMWCRYTGEALEVEFAKFLVFLTNESDASYHRTAKKKVIYRSIRWDDCPEAFEYHALGYFWKRANERTYLLYWDDGNWQHSFVTSSDIFKCKDFARVPNANTLMHRSVLC